MEWKTFEPVHARQVAEIHVEGQPGTFLTQLGINFLSQLYRCIAESPWAFGTVVLDDGTVAAVAVVATDTSDMFANIKRRYWYRLVWPLARQIVTHPSLLVKIWQSLKYPNTLEAPPNEAEVLFLGMRRAYMRHGIAPRLIADVLNEAYQRGCPTATTTIDKRNRAIRWTIADIPGVYVDHEIELHGNTMLVYRADLPIQYETHEKEKDVENNT
jgi:GNAT superfamily N-acetyltransferase